MTDTMSKHEMEAIQRKKIKTGQYVALGVILLYGFFAALILTHNSVLLPVLMGAIVLLFAPVTVFFYIKDVKKGVFKPTPEEEAEYAELLRKNEEEKAAQAK